jgi:sec-independent protein translocase protein TatC
MVAESRRRAKSPEGKMTLGDHLIELRRRLGVIGISVVLAAVGGWFLADPVWQALSSPVMEIARERNRDADINYTSVTEAFDTKVAIALVLGIVMAAPVWLYQVWAFFVPALKRKERRYAVGFLAAAVPLFFAGVTAGWLVLPNIVILLTGFAPEQSSTLLTAKVYLDFALKLVIAVGVGFVLPVFLVLFNAIGVLSARAIIGGWRWAIVVISVFTALATPAADVVSMVLLAIPMVILYFMAAGVAWINDRRVARKLARLVPDSQTTDE